MLQDVLNQFRPEILSLVVIAVLFAALYFVGLAATALHKSQFFVQNELFIKAIAEKALELILHTEYGNEYEAVSAEYEAKATARTDAGDFYIDPRMLFVIDKLETFVNTNFSQSIEFDDLLHIAEAKYREVKANESNSLLN